MPEPRAPSERLYPDRTLYRRLLRESKPFSGHLAGLLLVQLLATPIALVAPLPLQITVDHVLGAKPLPSWLAALLPAAWHAPDALLWVAAITLVVASLLVQVQEMVAWIYRTWVGERLVLELRSRLFRHVQNLSLAYHDDRATAESVYRVQNDASSIDTVVVQGLLRIVSVAVRVVVLVVVTARISGTLVLIALLSGPIMLVLTRVYRGRLRARWKDAKEQETEAMSVVQESLAAVRVVKAFGQEERERHRWLDRARASLDANVKAVSSHGGFDVLVGLTAGLAGAAVLYVGAREVRAGALTLGELLLIVGYLSQLFGPLREIGTKTADLQRALAGAERTFRVLDEAPEAPDRPGARTLARASGAVEFRGVTFGYGDGAPVLTDVSFEVPAGARVGIAGRTGSGKSTLLSLLFRFYDPRGGTILLDGVDTRDVRLVDLRRQFALVLQDTVLFSTTIAENIAYGRPDATKDEIVEAARAAEAHDFVTRLPKGYDTEVGERGVRLSGGERQRIALARAFLKDAPLLILDEPTSALDAATEASVIRALERLMAGRTTFMIAHRLSTLATCDVRLEVVDGRVVRRGADLSGVTVDGTAPERRETTGGGGAFRAGRGDRPRD